MLRNTAPDTTMRPSPPLAARLGAVADGGGGMRRGVCVASPCLVHAWDARGLHVLRLRGSGVVVAAATAGVWLALVSPEDDVDLRRGGPGGAVRVLCVEVGEGDVEVEGGGGAGVDVPDGVGAVRGLQERGGGVVVLGERGCVLVGEGGGVGKVLSWREERVGVRGFVVLGDGEVWGCEGVVRDVVVWGEAGGDVRVGSVGRGKAVGGVLRRGEGRVVAELIQQVVAVGASLDGSVVVVVCALGRGCCLYVGEGGSLAVSEFVMDVGRGTLRGCLRIGSDRAGRVVASSARNGAFVEVERRGPNGVAVRLGRRADPCAVAGSTGGPAGGARQGEALRDLLQAIDGATTARAEALRRAAAEDRVLASLNAATVFALAWKRGGGAGGLGVECWVTGARPAEEVRAGLRKPWAGGTAVLKVTLGNEAGIALGEGWVVQVLVRDRRVPGRVDGGAENGSGAEGNGGGGGVGGGNGEGAGQAGRPTSTQMRKFSRPIGSIANGERKEYSFYVDVLSHAPLYASVALVFFRTEDGDAKEGGRGLASASSRGSADPAEAMLRIPLRSQHCLDVFDLSSMIAADDPVADESHCLLPTARVADFFDPSGRSARPPPHLTSARVHLPVSVATVLKSISKPGQPIPANASGSMRRLTALGAPFHCELLRGASTNATTATLRAAAHVLPFVRSGLLRRVAAALQPAAATAAAGEAAATAGAAANGDIAGAGVGAAEPARVRLDERQVLDAADAAHRKLRVAEDSMVVVHGLMRELEELGRIDACIGARDRDAMRESLDAVRDVYHSWRQASAEFLG